MLLNMCCFFVRSIHVDTGVDVDETRHSSSSISISVSVSFRYVFFFVLCTSFLLFRRDDNDDVEVNADVKHDATAVAVDAADVVVNMLRLMVIDIDTAAAVVVYISYE